MTNFNLKLIEISYVFYFIKKYIHNLIFFYLNIFFKILSRCPKNWIHTIINHYQRCVKNFELLISEEAHQDLRSFTDKKKKDLAHHLFKWALQFAILIFFFLSWSKKYILYSKVALKQTNKLHWHLTMTWRITSIENKKLQIDKESVIIHSPSILYPEISSSQVDS